jgi:hypothetical protein
MHLVPRQLTSYCPWDVESCRSKTSSHAKQMLVLVSVPQLLVDDACDAERSCAAFWHPTWPRWCTIVRIKLYNHKFVSITYAALSHVASCQVQPLMNIAFLLIPVVNTLSLRCGGMLLVIYLQATLRPQDLTQTVAL